MNYKKYEVRSPLFALKDPRASEAVLAIFSGATLSPAVKRGLESSPRTVRVYQAKRAR